MSMSEASTTTATALVSGIGPRSIVVVDPREQHTEVDAVAAIVGQDFEHIPAVVAPSSSVCAWTDVVDVEAVIVRTVHFELKGEESDLREGISA